MLAQDAWENKKLWAFAERIRDILGIPPEIAENGDLEALEYIANMLEYTINGADEEEDVIQ